MEYTVIKQNDDGTALVRMVIDDHVLEQAFGLANLEEDVKYGMAIFKSELERNLPPVIDIAPLIGKTEIVEVLPELEVVEVAEEPDIAPELEEIIPEQPVDEPTPETIEEPVEPIIEPEEA